SHHGDARRIDIGILRKERQRVACRLHLIEADQEALLAFALAAAGHVETHADVAELLEHRGRPHDVLGAHAAAEAMQYDEGGTLLAWLHGVRYADDAREREAFRFERDFLFGHGRILSKSWVVIPAKAGIHRATNAVLAMGPRFCGARQWRELWTTSASRRM